MAPMARRLRAALLLATATLAAAAAGGASGADGDRPAPGGGAAAADAAAPPSDAEVNRAVERGMKFLRAEQHADGGFGTTPGETGLALWAMRHCGAAKDDPAAVRAAERLAKDLPDGNSYNDSLGLCGLLAHDPVAHRERIQKVLDELVKGQCDNGQWSYLCNRAGRSVGDNSNTQCVALALGAAKLRGFKVPAATTQRLLDFVVKTQNADGGWGYSQHQSAGSYGGMTAGMYMAWGLASASLVGVDPRTIPLREDPVAVRATAWLGRSFDPATNPGNGEFTIYWLWSMERAGTILGFDRVGKHPWYAEGARWLLSRQTDKGAWTDERTVPDTCWALLFLRRGTVTVITPRDGEIPPASATTPK